MALSDNALWATQLSWFFYTHSYNFRLFYMILTLPCDWSEHTLLWHNWHAWPCSSRIRHISLLQHTSRLLIFLSMHLSEAKQLSLLVVQRQEDGLSKQCQKTAFPDGTRLGSKWALLTLCLHEHLIGFPAVLSQALSKHPHFPVVLRMRTEVTVMHFP